MNESLLQVTYEKNENSKNPKKHPNKTSISQIISLSHTTVKQREVVLSAMKSID
jgi:hypothetical protein